MTQPDWQTVLAEHNRWLRTVVLARVGQRSAVDEVMQEVALAAVRQQSPLVDPARVGPWLYRLAVRQSLLFRRKAGRGRKLTARYAERAQFAESEQRVLEPLDWLLADERRALVRRALAHLSRRDAEILLLKYTEGWSYQQLAERLGVSSSAVEARLHRARARLRNQLAAVESTAVERT